MKKEIVTFIKDLKSNKKLDKFDEASTKQAVVLRLFSFLGWDIFNVDEVYPDFSVNSHSVSYALRAKNSNKIFIEVKRVHEKLDNYQKRLLTFASGENVDIAILTNGVLWWFYLPKSAGNSQEKWFCSVDLLKQKEDTFVPQLMDLLSKNKVVKGQALKAAKTLNQNKNQKIASNVIPEAWNKIISQPNMIFVELLRESTEKICGCRVEAKLVERFLEKHLDKWLVTSRPSASAAPPPKVIEVSKSSLNASDVSRSRLNASDVSSSRLNASDVSSSRLNASDVSRPAPKKTLQKPESYIDKEIKSYAFNGKTNPARYWEDLLTDLCDYFAAIHSRDFEKVLWISGEDKTYFSRYSDQLRIPEKIKGSDIYVETKLGPDEIVKTSRSLLREFGYDATDLSITVK
jgi:predicted type IV restriction endonuclease